MGNIWHIGIAVLDLDLGKKQLADVFGLRWRPVRVRELTLADAAGRRHDVTCHVAFSLGGLFAVEVWPGRGVSVRAIVGDRTSMRNWQALVLGHSLA